MRVVYKYPLVVTDEQEIKMPLGAEALAVKMQEGVVTLWAMVDPDAEATPYRIRIIGTGNPIRDGYLDAFEFVGTVMVPSATMARGFVWHVYLEHRHG